MGTPVVYTFYVSTLLTSHVSMFNPVRPLNEDRFQMGSKTTFLSSDYSTIVVSNMDF